MARIKGQANYASNFEVLKQAPLDSRTVVSEAGDLTKIATWQDADGNVWLYDGLIVVVPNADNANAPEVYVLKDKDNYGRPDAWLKLGSDNASEVAAIQEALKKKANLANGKVPANELPIVTSFNAPGDITIPSSRLVNENIQAVKSNLETEINNKVVGLLHWQGVKSTTSEIKAITSAKKGDVWHSNGDGSEWVCTQDITTANADAWTELGTPINLSGYYTKTEVDKKVKPLADSIGTDSDAASANGSLYARIKKNAADIVTKASNSDLAALQSKVELKANQSDINGALIQNLTTASTEADIRKAFTEVNTKTVLFPTPGSIITKLNGNNKGIVVSLSEPDATTLGRTITVYHGNDTYTIIVKSDFTKVLMPWSKVSSKRNIYSNDIANLTSDLSEADIKGLLTPLAYKKYNIIYPIKPQTGDLMEAFTGDDKSRFIPITALCNQENPDEYTDIFIPKTGRDNRYTKIVLKNDLTSVQSYDTVLFENYRRYYEGEQLLALDTVKAETIENSISDAYTIFIKEYGQTTTAQLPKVGDLIRMVDETEGYAPVCEVLRDRDGVQHTRWFYKGKLYEVAVNTALTRVPEDPKVVYDTTSGTLRDLYISAGAVYNEATGFYELNGLTDITEEEMREIYNRYLIDIGSNVNVSGWLILGAKIRTNLPCITRADIFNEMNLSISGSNVEVLRICAASSEDYFRGCYIAATMAVAHDPMPKLKKVIGIWRYNDPNPNKFDFSYGQPFSKCPLLEEIRMEKINKSHTFAVSPNLSKESVLYMITNANPPSGAAVGSITITLHPTAYARLKDDADIVAALEAKRGIVTLVSA